MDDDDFCEEIIVKACFYNYNLDVNRMNLEIDFIRFCELQFLAK